MKRIVFFVVAGLLCFNMSAQNTTDGLRYSMDQQLGSARYQAMSGAFGALGGELTSIGLNPAGSAVFINNTGAVSLGVLGNKNESNYFGTNTNVSDTDVSINQAGAVFLFNNANENSSWNKFSIGLNYNNSKNFDNDLIVQGNGNKSIANFFLEQAQGFPLDLLELRSGESIDDLYLFLGQTQGTAAQNAFLGYQGFIFDPVTDDPDNTQYTSNVAPGSFNQQYALFTQGYKGKFTLNFATQYREKFFFGINLNSHYLEYNEFRSISESNSNSGSTIEQINYQNNLSTLGSGFSAQLGAIARITDSFRVGLTYDTPTWYEISEETVQFLETDRRENNQTIITTVDPRVINVFENYNLKTPGKITASTAYIFNQQGLISFDYSIKDYSGIKFRPGNDPTFINVNNNIENNLKSVSTYRIGGEYRFGMMSLRGGYLYEESPYEDNMTIGDTQGFSTGIGFNFGNYNFDLAYSRIEQQRDHQLYSIGLTDSARVDNTFSNLIFTLGFNL